jgi:peptide/nickel transport system substrate-binding protein
MEGVVGQPTSFLPGASNQHYDRTISKLLFRGLFKYDIYGTLVPDLADTWTISQDGLVYTIKIKDNQRWSDGHKITSNDLIYTAFNHPDLSGVATDKVDELTVRYILPNHYAPFLNMLTAGISHEGAKDEKNELMPVSSGDFKVVRVERKGQLVKKVTLYNSKSPLKKLIFRYYKNEEDVQTAAKLGEIEGFVSENELSVENFEDYKFPLQGIYYALFFNLKSEKFQTELYRKKIEKALPIKQVVEERGINVEGPISRSLFTDKEIKFDAYDELYNEDLGDFEFTLTVPDLPEHRKTAQNIKQYLRTKTGIKVNIKTVNPENIIKDIIEPRNFEALLYGQEVSRDPDRYVYWHSQQAEAPGLNITGFSHIRSDRALEEGRNELENEKRVKHYAEFQKVFMEHTPAIFLYHPYIHYYINNHIVGIGDKYTFNYEDRFLDYYNWKRITEIVENSVK